MDDLSITELNPENLQEEGLFCISNPKHIGFQAKQTWFEKRYADGLKMKILKNPSNEKLGYIEYIPAEFSWRPVDAPNFTFIHCMFIYGKKHLGKGLGAYLIKECLRDAEHEGKSGVAVVVSSGTWMAGKEIFEKNGFQITDRYSDEFELMALNFKEARVPKFPKDLRQRASAYKGLNIIYSDQCPYAAKGLVDIKKIAEQYQLNLHITRLDNPKQIREASPSPYGTFSLVYEGKIVAHHCISGTRFKNITKSLKIV